MGGPRPKPDTTAAAASMKAKARERKARERERKKSGAMIVGPLVCPASAIEALIDGGDLPAWDAADKRAVDAAIERHLARIGVVTL